MKKRNLNHRYISCLIILIAVLAFASGCRQQMADQPRINPLAENNFFKDGLGSRPPVEGTVARGQLRDDKHLYTGYVDGKLVDTFPFPVTKEVVERGRDRFNIYCAVCHDKLGTGEGMIVKRGLRKPPSYHIERLRKDPVGHYFDVITNGFGAMQGYNAQVNVRDRWAIIAYIRALQASQPVAPDPADPKLAGTPLSTQPGMAATTQPSEVGKPGEVERPTPGTEPATSASPQPKTGSEPSAGGKTNVENKDAKTGGNH